MLESGLTMKRVAIVTVTLLALGYLVYEFGGRYFAWRLNRAFRVTEFEWKLPTNAPAVLSESFALEGIDRAFRSISYDPSVWKPVPGPTEENLTKNLNNPNSGVIDLSNTTSAARLFGRVELDTTNRVMKVNLSRPK